jgi:hypothetical protein
MRWLPRGWARNAVFALTAILVLTCSGVVALWFGSTLSVDQRIAGISAVLAFAVLAVAVLAAVVAIAAYLFTIRRPNLTISLSHTDDGAGTQIISPNLSNYGDATAVSARVTFTFFHASVVQTQWQHVAENMISWDVANVHKSDTIPVLLPAITIHFAPEEPNVAVEWKAVADRVNNSGLYLLNIRPKPI